MLKATRIAKIAAVVLLAGSTLAATTAAQAYVPNVFPQQQRHNWWYHNHNYGYPGYGNGYGYPGYGYGYGYDNGGGIVAGMLGGLFAGAVVGSVANQSYYDGNSCYRFRTYNPAAGMYMSNHGPRHCP